MAADGFTPEKILSEVNVLPSGYEGDPLVLGAVLTCTLGFLIVSAFDRFGPRTD
jgi:putative membrane protein